MSNNPPSLFEMMMVGWWRMITPWIDHDKKVANPSPISMHEDIEDYTIKRISNHNYERMSVENKKRLMEEYRMIALNDPDFYGFWMLIPKDGAVALRDEIDREIVAEVIESSKWTDHGI